MSILFGFQINKNLKKQIKKHFLMISTLQNPVKIVWILVKIVWILVKIVWILVKIVWILNGFLMGVNQEPKIKWIKAYGGDLGT